MILCVCDVFGFCVDRISTARAAVGSALVMWHASRASIRVQCTRATTLWCQTEREEAEDTIRRAHIINKCKRARGCPATIEMQQFLAFIGYSATAMGVVKCIFAADTFSHAPRRAFLHICSIHGDLTSTHTHTHTNTHSVYAHHNRIINYNAIY